MSLLIDETLLLTNGKPEDDIVSVRVSDLKTICSQAKARGQMIKIYEELLAYSAEAITIGTQNLDLAGTIISAISTK